MMNKKEKEIMKWTKDKLKQLQDLLNRHMTVKEVAREMGTTISSVVNTIYRKGVVRPEKLAMPDRKDFPKGEKLLDYIELGHKVVRKADPRQREVFPIFKTDKWVALACDGDWHFDHYKTDLGDIRASLEEFDKEKYLFWLFNGDAGDWSDLRFKDMNLPSTIVPISIRYEALMHLVDKLENLLAITAGCHDDWLKNRGWYDIPAALQKRSNRAGFKTYYLGYGGTINFKVGNHTYRIAMHHKMPGESMHNIFHPCMRYLKEIDSTADVVIASHRHDKMGVSFLYWQHQARVLVRTGGRQYITDYAWKEGFAGAINRIPVVLLNSQKKEMVAMPSLKEGIKELRRLNKC